jgi:AraC-like DNA-binding protein/mannose-6-phosphate isomerase-like protein (cupin superfamily)
MSIRSERRPPAVPAALPFDVLTDVMEQVRLEGTVYFSAELRAPWGISIVRSGRAPFYAVTAGECELQVGRRGAVRRVRAGDFVLLPSAAPHVVRSGKEALVVPFDSWLQAHPIDRRGATRHAGPGAATRVTGGFFSVDPLRINPLFGALPPLIHLRGDDARVRESLAPTLRLIEREIAAGALGARTVLRRLADVLFIQAVRLHADDGNASAGWLRGLAEPRVGRALTLLHERYAEPWTLESLAREAGTSRTLLAVRFRELVGEPPMAYLARWRITRAANLLHGARQPLARIAEQVGYQSDAVFSKAFRRLTGNSPREWRRLAPPAAMATAEPVAPAAPARRSRRLRP